MCAFMEASAAICVSSFVWFLLCFLLFLPKWLQTHSKIVPGRPKTSKNQPTEPKGPKEHAKTSRRLAQERQEAS